MVTVKKIEQTYDNMSEAESASLVLDLRREMLRLQGMIETLRQEGKGLRFTDDGWSIVPLPGINALTEEERREMEQEGV